jgi:hypothetical protein
MDADEEELSEDLYDKEVCEWKYKITSAMMRRVVSMRRSCDIYLLVLNFSSPNIHYIVKRVAN